MKKKTQKHWFNSNKSIYLTAAKVVKKANVKVLI